MDHKLVDRTIENGVLGSWLWHTYLKKHMLSMIAAVVFMAIQGSLLGVLSYQIGPMFDEVFLTKDHAALLQLAVFVFGIFVVRGLTGFVHRMITTNVGERMWQAMRNDLMHQVLRLDYLFFLANSPGELMERINNDTSTVKNLWGGLVASGARDSIAILSLLVVAVTIDWKWTVVTFVAAPLLVMPVFILQRITRHWTKIQRASASRISVRMNEIFHGILSIKAFGLEELQKSHLSTLVISYRRATMRVTGGAAAVPALVDLLAGVGFFGMLILAGGEVIAGTKSIGQFMSFFTAVILLFDPIRRIGGLLTSWQIFRVSLSRIYIITEQAPSIVRRSARLDSELAPGAK